MHSLCNPSFRFLFLPGFTKSVVLSAYADNLVVCIQDQQDIAALNDVTSLSLTT